MKKSPPKKIGKKRWIRIESGGSEFLFFHKKILSRTVTRDGYRCELTGRILIEDQIYVHCFPHILSKGMYPQYRLNPENVLFVANSKLHKEVDRLTAGRKFELEEKLKEGTLRAFIQELFREEHPEFYGCLD